MMQNGTNNASKDEGELNLERVVSELRELVDARIEIHREVGFVAVKSPTEDELSVLFGYVQSSDSIQGYPVREEDKLIVKLNSRGDNI